MALKLQAFDIPKRPTRIAFFRPSLWLSHGAMLALFGYLTGTWLSLILIAYVLGGWALFWMREWTWNHHADRCDGTFVSIGKAADALSVELQRIADAIDARNASATDSEIEAESEDVDTAISVSVDPSVTGEVRYWASDSKGTN